MRRRLVPGRWPGAGLAAGGVLLAAPSIFWPIVVMTSSNYYDAPPSRAVFRQGLWSWGKSAPLGVEGLNTAFDASGTWGLVFLITSLAIGTGGALVWVLVPELAGESLGLAGTVFAAASQLGSLTQGAGQQMSVFYDPDRAVQQLAGSLRVASVVVLLVALGFMLGRPLRASLVPAWRRLNGAEPETVGIGGDSSEQSLASTTGGTTPLRDDEVGDAGLSDGPLRRDAESEVGFSDEKLERLRNKRPPDPRR